MKNYIRMIAAGAIAAAALCSCSEDSVLPPVPVPEGGIESIGSGAWDKPISTFQCVQGFKSETESELWTCGYIVGWIDTDATPTHALNAESARFQAECNIESNLLIAQNADETDWTKCASVQLPSGPVRNALNLAKNPGNYKKQVCLKGETGTKYCGAYGIRSTSAFNWGSEGIYEEPQEPVPPVPGILDNITFSKVDNIDGPGQYLLVFNGGLMAGPVEPSNYSYGYLPVKSITPADGRIVTSTLNSFYFYEAEGGWEIRDAYGRYLWWDSEPSHKSFQLTPKRGAEGMIWTVTPVAGGAVEIKNVEMNVTIQYSEQFQNISGYTIVNAPLPVLYKRDR